MSKKKETTTRGSQHHRWKWLWMNFVKAKDMLHKNKVVRAEQEALETNMQDLPIEILDMILLKAIPAMSLETDQECCSLSSIIYEIVTKLRIVSSIWDNRLTTKWMEIKIRRIRDRLPEIDDKSGPVLIETIRTKSAKEENREIRGLTILDEELFIISGNSSEVEVYSSIEFSFIHRFELRKLINPCNVESCSRNMCLYIMNRKDQRTDTFDKWNEILRVHPNGILIKYWSTGHDFGLLSVTDKSNVIVTVHMKNKLNEYSPDGHLIREMKLSSGEGFLHPHHAIKLTDDHIVVTHGDGNDHLHRVCLVDIDGNVKKSFGGRRGWTIGQLDHPVYLATDGSGSILVADWKNSRVLLLDSNLKFKKQIVYGKKHGLRDPTRICLDESKGRLYVVENKFVREKDLTTYGRVLIYDVKENRKTTN